jgi:3',5'-cyclic AMP phosphodiesterase CpdA
MPAPITIAHLTDVHLGPIAGFEPRYWNLKRLLGYLNWLRNRRSAYQRDALDRILADLEAQQPDHIAVTGDLVNIGLPQEHINALAWLEELGSPGDVTVIPGNHDIYSGIGADRGTRRWAPYMASDAAGKAIAGESADFPFVRVLGGLALVGVNSATPTPPFAAWGKLGAEQLARLAGILDQLREEDLFRLVLVHHPPLQGQARPTRALRDAASLEAVLAEHGAELVIHGHNHHNMLTVRPTVSGPMAVVGAPSASLGRNYKNEPLARYNLYRVAGDGPWTVELVGRGLAEPGGPVLAIERRILSLGDRRS